MSGKPPRNPRKLAFEDLPKFLRDYIKVPAGQEHSACWIWTGRVQASRQKRNLYRGGEHPELRENPGRYGRERPTPRMPHHFTGKDVDAHRLVFSFATCTAVEDLPRLKRCGNDECVSPYCSKVARPLTVAERRRGRLEPEAETEPAPEPEIYTHERCMELLRTASGGEGVEWGITKDEAADEAGIPRDQLTEASWAQYVREEMAKEDEENDDAD